jgi:putative spermidine/putrescine transport system permease protein
MRRLWTFFYKYSALSTFLLLLPVLLWLGVMYFGSLLSMLQQSLYTVDYFTGLVVEESSLDTYRSIVSCTELGDGTQDCRIRDSNLDIVERSVLMAAATTLGAAILAFPLAYYMARYASYRVKGIFYLLVLVPLWSSYLVRVYSWKLILSQEGVIYWFFETFRLTFVLEFLLNLPYIGGRSLSVSYLGMWMVFVYIWLPYMILPIQAAIERVPRSLLDASSDLGATPRYTFRRVVLPLAFPGVVAGSIFTFSLTLGDYIVPNVIGNSAFFIGSYVYTQQGAAGNLPLAAAFTVIPILIMGGYLALARRLGAFDAL